jgi:tetratricopeptide (TPR) repeat protein
MLTQLKYWHWQCIIAVLIVLIYGSTASFEYAVDDLTVITENRFTQLGAKGIGKILTTDSFAGHYPEGAVYDYKNRYYRPLSLISFALEKQFLGNRPGFSHIVNMLIYIGLCWVVLHLLLVMRLAASLAGITTLIFSVHPIHTEAVANIKGRDELLSFALGLLSLYFLATYLGINVKEKAPTLSSLRKSKENKRWRLIAFGVCFLLALLSKEQSFTFLLIFPFTIFFFCEKQKAQLLKLGLALGLVLAAYGIWRISYLGLPPSLQTDSLLNDYYLQATLAEKIATQIKVLGFYCRLLIMPYPLSWDYSWNAIPYSTFSDPQFGISLFLYSTFFCFGLWSYWKGKNAVSCQSAYSFYLTSWSILFYFASLSIVSNFFINIGGYVGERFLFQASLGFILLLILLFSRFLSVLTQARLALNIAIMAFIALLTLGSIFRVQNWKNNVTLFLRDVAAVPTSAKANAAAGGALITLANQAVNKQNKMELLKQAKIYLQKAIELHPTYVYPILDLSRAHLQSGDTATAEKLWYQAQKIAPQDEVTLDRGKELAVAHQNKANLLLSQPELYLQEVEKVLSFYKSDPEIWYNAAQMYSAVGKQDKALSYLQNAIALNPMQERYHYAIGVIYYRQADFTKALAAWRATLKLNPSHSEAQKGVLFLERQNIK